MKRRAGFSLIELLVVVAIVMILSAVAIPGMKEAIMTSHHSAAVQTIRTIHATQAQFYGQFRRFAKDLGELASARLIDREMASGERSGYRFSLNGGESGYTIHADPLKEGQTGRVHYYSDDTLTVRQSPGPEPASADSPPL
jgi:type IV pilus assembly protein PilA